MVAGTMYMAAVRDSCPGRQMALRNDADLVRGVLAGDRSAFADLYDRYAPLVRAICHDSTGDSANWQDLSQDVFLGAYQRLDNLRDPARFGGWLVGIARNTCRRWCRSRSRDRHRYVGLRPDDPPADCEAPDDRGLTSLRRAIEELPERERLALRAFYLLGESADDARAALGLSRSGFYQALARARNRLRRRMGGSAEDPP